MSKILIIDDNREYAESLEIALQARSHQVMWAPDSIAGMEIIESELPDLIILDIIMSSIGEGVLLAYKLKSDPRYSRIPIIMLTGITQLTGLKFNPKNKEDILPVECYMEKSEGLGALCSQVERILIHSNK